ncbi:tRNA (adenosine(37)-N6)-threonylcarbamoyltransferase complex dimerization subunit type 1 TsaB [Nesterenkonia alba]|uniref:tRNA (adenosine(37)-N6)-threonylcarbamoyltransferase complex dimerization subunit type 1 TsaB n=1 Tax=Nesterenkonia alba TaxID=515814 RepID=UPI00048AAD6D|nr:tRNA (adenosine(37)-N6)-threonylcarbamoyltransferase complex dimerization subunit type 1 TsaB [Nesterenkonia alba]
MLLLALDTSAGASAALVSLSPRSSSSPGASQSPAGPEPPGHAEPVGPQVLAAEQTPATTAHAEWLVPAAQRVLAASEVAAEEITGVVVGVGPGPFTGLRVGLAAAHGLALGWRVPVHGVCSLDALALRTVESTTVRGEFLVATDARRREVYWAEYVTDDDGSRLIQGPFVSSPAELPDLPAVGAGVGLYPEVLQLAEQAPAEAAEWTPHAAELGCLAASALSGDLFGVLCEPRPLYLRESDAQVPAQMRKAG